MAKVIIEPGRIQVLERMSPYDEFVVDFLQTMNEIQGVLISGYPAIMLGRPRQTEDIDMFVAPMERNQFDAWWQRLHDVGFWCINAGNEDAWSLLQEGLAPRFAREGTIDPNMEIKFPRDPVAQQQMKDAWELDLLGCPGQIGDLANQVAFKVYMGTTGEDDIDWGCKDLEDALHIAQVGRVAIDWNQSEALAYQLGVPKDVWSEFDERRNVS